MKSLMLLTETILDDASIECCVSTSRDLQTIRTRTKMEGLSFLTITLPQFCKSFERSLDQSMVSKHDFLGFKRNRGLPAFLQGFLSLIFDHNTGRLKDNPSISAIFAVRQICLAFKKLRSDCTNNRIKATIEQYLLTDLDVHSFESELPDHLIEVFNESFAYIFAPVLDKMEKKILADPYHLLPRHGPGTTADGTRGNRKYDSLTWTQRLNNLLPYDAFLLPNSSYVFDRRGCQVNILSPGQEPPVRVVTVPKTLKAPRIIAIEPVHMQYVQQGLLEMLVAHLESYPMYGALGFSDQSESQHLARLGSKYGWVSTLDLSEASDRVSNLLVDKALARWPKLHSLVMACRSATADVPGYGIHPISKFASMGSALCFPIEAMVFLTCCFLGYTQSGGRQYGLKGRSSFLKSVRIYGDDIIVPIEMTQSVISELSRFNLKVNAAKSFWTGKFRESCGGDFYDGYSVKPVYIKTSLPQSRADVDSVVSTVACRNQFYRNGYWRTAALIDKTMKGFAPFPIVSPESELLARHSFLPVKGRKLCSRLHRKLELGLVLKTIPEDSPVSGEGALMKFFLKRGNEPTFSKDHLKRTGRPKIATLNLRWAAA